MTISDIDANVSADQKDIYNVIGLGQSITKDYIINRYGNGLRGIKASNGKNFTPGKWIYNESIKKSYKK